MPARFACLLVCDVISEKRNDTKVRIDFAMSPRGEGTAEGGWLEEGVVQALGEGCGVY